MALDPGIFGMVGRGVKSVNDYDMEAAQLDQARTAGEANKLALLLNRQKADEYTRGVEEQNRLRSLLAGATTNEERIRRARQSGLPSGFQLADTIEKGDLERQKTAAQIGEQNAKAAKDAYELGRKRYEHRISGLSQFQDVEGAKQWLADSVTKGDLGMDEATRMIQKIPTDPAAFGQWKNDTIFALNDAAKQAGYIRPDANATLSAQTSAANNAATNARMAAEGAANRANAVTVANIRAANADKPPKPPKDMRYNADGDLEPIPGSATDVKRKEAVRKAESFAGEANDRFDRIDMRVDRLLASPALGGTKKSNTLDVATGLRGVVARRIPGSDAADFEAQKESILANLGFKELADMRASSPTGGALGSITEKELGFLQASVASLQAAQSPEAMKQALKDVKDAVAKSRERINAAASADTGGTYTPKKRGQPKAPASPLGQASRFGGQAPAAAPPASGPTVSNW